MMPDKVYIVEYTPGPPAIGVLTKKIVSAESADDANNQIKVLHPDWCMIHRTTEIGD